MNPLNEYVLAHTERGACTCGRCADAPADAASKQPTGHTADLVFFKVCAKDNPDAATLKKLVQENAGEFCKVDLFDGTEHSYLEVGGFVGDQGLALQLMGLGALLGLWKLLTPRSVFGRLVDEAQAQALASAGYVSVRSTP